MYITNSDAKNQLKFLKANMKSISKLCKKIAKFSHREPDIQIIRAIEIDLSQIYVTISTVSIHITGKVNLETIMWANDILVEILVFLIYMYDDLKNKKYNKRVTNEQYKQWQEQDNAFNHYVDNLLDGLENYKNNIKQ